MALQKQFINFEFTQGVSTKDDPKIVPMGKLLALQNGVFISPGRITKRNGYVALSQNILGGGTISNGIGLDSFVGELILLDGSTLYSYSNSSTEWVNKGVSIRTTLANTPVTRTSSQQTSPDSCVSGNIQFFVYEDSTGGLRYTIIDSFEPSQIVSNQPLVSTGIKPKVLTLGTNTIVIYVDSSTGFLRYIAIANTAPYTVASPVTLSSVLNASQNYDATIINGNCFIAFHNATTLTVIKLVPALTTSTTTTSDVPSGCLTIFGDSSFNAWIAYYTTGVGVKYVILSQTLTSVLTTTTIDPDTTDTITKIIGIYSSSETKARIYYEVSGTPNYNYLIRSSTATVSGTVVVIGTFNRSVGLASKPFIFNSVVYILSTYDSSLQPGYFLFNESGFIVAKISPQEGGGILARNILPEVNLLGSSYQFSILVKDFATALDGNVYFQTGVNQATIVFNNINLVTLELANNIHVPGGILSMYDGANLVEHSFNVFPETTTGDYLPAMGGLSAGSYSYVAVYEWFDRQGQIQRSAPSIPQQVVIDGHQTYIVGATTSTQANITNVELESGLATGIYDIAAGMLYISPEFPVGTYISSIATGITQSLYTFTMSAAATATVPTEVGYFNANLNFANNGGFSTIPGTKYIVSAGSTQLLKFAGFTNGTSTLTVANTTGITAGMTVTSDFPSNSVTVNSVSGNTVTLSGSFSYTNEAAGQVFTYANIIFTTIFTATATVGNPTVTGVASSVFPAIKVGSLISDSAGFSHIVLSTNPGANTITFTVGVPSGGGGSLTFTQYIPPTSYLEVGMSISGTGITGSAFITGFTPFSSSITYLYKIAISQEITAVATNATYSVSTSNSVYLNVPTLRLTNKTNAQIVIYRTAVNGTTYFRTTLPAAPLLNNTSVDTVTFLDTVPDEVLIGNEQIYTTGGEVENISAPATEIQVSYKNRSILIPNEARQTWWYSKQVIPGNPVEFSDLFVGNIDQFGGDITALAAMDDKLIFFKKTTIYYIVGNGPSPNGTNNDFSNPLLVTSDAGAIDPQSVVRTPVGIMFSSDKGIYILDRSLNVNYVGKEVEFYTNLYSVTSAQLIEQTNQVRFTLNTNIILVYDYLVEQWATFTNLQGNDSANWKDNFTFLQPNGLVLTETPGTFTDNGAFIPLSLTTSWLSFAGIQGFQRVYHFNILGDYYSPHTLTASVSSNFTSTVQQSPSFVVSANPSVYEYRVFLSKQKAETVQITLTETQTANFGQGLSLSGLAFQVGIKGGTNRLSAARSSS